MILLVADAPRESASLQQALRELGQSAIAITTDKFIQSYQSKELLAARGITGLVVWSEAMLAASAVARNRALDVPVIGVVLGGMSRINNSKYRGLDDFIRQPIDPIELIARVEQASAKIAAAIHSPADIVVENDGCDAVIAGVPLRLPRRERRILSCLLSRRGAYITKSQLFESAYSYDDDDLDDTVVESHICRLRKKLKGVLEYDPIESERYLGYRLSPPR